jgi:hypothetical protein
MSKASEYCQLKNEIFKEQKNILQNGSTLATDAEINTMLQKFSLTLQRKSNHVATRMRCLESEIQKVDAEVSQVIDNLLVFSDLPGQAGEFVASEKDNEVDGKRYQLSGMEASRDSMNPHELERRSQPDEVDTIRQDRVIQLGIDALHLFKDSRRDDFDSGEDFELNNENCGDWDSENARSFQQYASGDIFNQRSIPFMIGSRKFLESASGE